MSDCSVRSQLMRGPLARIESRRALLLVAAIAVACGGPEAERDTAAELPRYTADGLLIAHSDVDQDGSPDVLKYYREEEDPETGEVEQILVRTEIDLNGDGLVNLRRVYSAEGDLTLEEMDGNLDGRMDHTVYWEYGFIVRSERDDDHDGRVDEVRHYRDGNLNRVLRDTDGDGDIDVWVYYGSQGIDRIGYDTDGDGEADRWNQRGE